MQSPFASRRALFGSIAVVAVAAVGLTSLASNSSSAAKNGGAEVRILDRCDPATFDAALGNPNACVKDGGVTFTEFLATLNPQVGGHEDWEFKPTTLKITTGTTLRAVNRGGEQHTFTEVLAFGAGIVPLAVAPLNLALSDPNTPAVQANPAGLGATFVNAGASLIITGLAPGVHMFQCMIHPWMRTTVTVAAKN